MDPANKAQQLLLEHLNPRQQKQFQVNRGYYFDVVGEGSHQVYRVYSHGVSLLDDRNQDLVSYCIHHSYHYPLPPADTMLALKLLLETDEKKFLKIANPSWASYSYCPHEPVVYNKYGYREEIYTPVGINWYDQSNSTNALARLDRYYKEWKGVLDDDDDE